MTIYIDVKTLALTTEGHVPLTDMTLVRGDKIPLRIVLTDGPGQPAASGEAPVLAVKKSLGDDALVLAATGLERVEDALGVAYVGSLSVNTVQLADALGEQSRIDLIGEVVLVAPDGAQRTSRLIRVTVRADLLPGDYAPPEDVLANWEEMVAASLAAQLPDALHKAGMYVTPQGGTTVLTTDMTPTHRRDVTYYRLPLDHHNVVGHMASGYTVNSVTLRANPHDVPVYIEIHKLVNDSYTLLGRSLNAIAPSNANQEYIWCYPPGLTVRSDDTIILRVVRVDGTDAVLTLAITQVGAHTPESGADIVDGLVDPQRVINPAYPGIRHLLYVRIGVAYTDGVSVGGVELATKDDFDHLTANVIETGEQVHADAAQAEDARQTAQEAATNAASSATTAQQALAAIPQVDGGGNMTLAGGMTAAGTINANGGVNIPASPVTDTDAARLREVRILNEIANADAGNYFGFTTVPFGTLLSRFAWLATYWPKPATENGWVEFNFHCNPFGQEFDRGGSYTGATGIFFPLSCCLGYQRMFNVVAGGLHHVTLNEEWTGPDDHPFTSPSEGVSMWWDVYFQDRDADNNIPVRGRLCRYNHNTKQVELLTKAALLPDNFRLRGIAVAWARAGAGDGGIWVVGCNDSNNGRLEAYRVGDDTWPTSSYAACINAQHIRLLCNRGALDVGVGALKTYPGVYGQQNVVAEWCKMMEVK